MRYDEVNGAYPHVGKIRIDPADLRAVERAADEREQFRITDVDRSAGDNWTVTVACASRRVLDGLQERFG